MGSTALDAARARGHERVEALLVRTMKKQKKKQKKKREEGGSEEKPRRASASSAASAPYDFYSEL